MICKVIWGRRSVPGRRVGAEGLAKGLLDCMSAELLDLKDAVLEEVLESLRGDNLLLREPKRGILVGVEVFVNEEVFEHRD